MKKKWKSLISLLLVGSMCFTLLPITGFAAEGAQAPSAVGSEVLPETPPETTAPPAAEQVPEQETAPELVLAPDTYATDTVVNLALGKPATASSTEGGTAYPWVQPAGITDGTWTALIGDHTGNYRWSSDPVAAGGSQWIYVDLGAQKPVQSIGLRWLEASRATAYKLAYSNDTAATKNWTELTSVSDTAFNANRVYTLPATTNMRYVRVEATACISAEYGVCLYEMEVFGVEPPVVVPENLARGKTVTASSVESNASDEPYPKFNQNYVTDGKKNKEEAGKTGDVYNDFRWSSKTCDATTPQWIQVDLGAPKSIEAVKIYWEDAYASKYTVQISDDATAWETVVTNNAGAAGLATHNLSAAKTARYVRVHATERAGAAGTTISIWELEVYNVIAPDVPTSDANVMLNRPATTSSNEVPYFDGPKAVDGSRGHAAGSDKESRWASALDAVPCWLQVDMGQVLSLKKLVVYWEQLNVTGFKIQLSDTGAANSWRDVASFTATADNPCALRQSFVLATPQSGRYARVYVSSLAGAPFYNTASIWEFEGYQTDVKTLDDYLPTSFTIPLSQTELPMPDMTGSGYTLRYLGTDYEQVIDKDRVVHHPIIDTHVITSFTLTRGDEKSDLDIPALVKGAVATNTGNPEPSVVPELREWVGGTGNFTAGSKIVLNTANEALLRPMAAEFAADYKDLFGKILTITTGTAPAAGDFFFKLGSTDAGLGKEGYRMAVTDSVSVEAVEATGAYWSTRTILQILKQNSGTTMPQGTTRDYPKFEVRGLVMDVGRKPFSEKFLDDLSKNLSWYKMNDLQTHLADNVIFLNEYSNAGEDPMNAYSGFRLESDCVGANGVHLTNTDEFYTKAWFSDFIDSSKVRGVNIVPEFDTPAHSLAFNKVRPDLKLNTDHLNVGTKTDEVAAFIQSIYNEYMTGPNPVFKQDTIIHIGTDEFNGNDQQKQGFVNYMDKMMRFVQASGRKVRAWGSLSSAAYPGSLHPNPVVSKDVQLNMWYPGYADPRTMYNLGFGLINAQDSQVYIVPDTTCNPNDGSNPYYPDYQDPESKYNGFTPYNMGGGFKPPAGSPQILGGEYALWNDMIDTDGNGLAQYDVADRLLVVMPAMAEKLWGEGKDKTYAQLAATVNVLGNAPSSNPRGVIKSTTDTAVKYELNGNANDSSGNGYDGTTLTNASFDASGHEGSALRLGGGNSSLELPLTTGGPQYSIEMWVKKDAGAARGEQILLEADGMKIQAVRKDTGKVGFTREEYDYSFNYTLPENTWVKLKFECTRYGSRGATKLFVNDVWQDTLCRENISTYTGATTYDSRPGGFNATMLVPLDRIGSTTHAFKGLIDQVVVTKSGAQTLQHLIEEVENLPAANYLQDAQWTAMKNLLPAAKTTQSGSDAAAKATAATNLQNARNAVHVIPTWKLDSYIARAESMNAADYTPESWEGLQTRLASAKATADAPVGTGEQKLAQQRQIRNAWVKMHVGIRDLVNIENAPPARDKFYYKKSGGAAMSVSPNGGPLTNAIDGNLDTFVQSSSGSLAVGDTCGITYAAPTTLSHFRVLSGVSSYPDDRVYNAVLEYRTSGATEFTPVPGGGVMEAAEKTWDFSAAPLQNVVEIRLRHTSQHTNWLVIREMGSYDPAARPLTPLQDMTAETFTDAAGTVLPYRRFLPKNFDATKTYPLLVFLHGAGERGSDNAAQVTYNVNLLTRIMNSTDPNQQCIIVAPQCAAGKQWVDTPWANGTYQMDNVPISTSQKAVLALIQNVRTTYKVDANRIYAAGLSMGGYGTWDLLMRNPDLFAGALAVCGAADTTKAASLKNVPVWAFHGAIDDTVPVTGSRDMTAAMTAAGNTSVKYTEYPGVSHASWTPAFNEPELLNWLFSKTKTVSTDAFDIPRETTTATAGDAHTSEPASNAVDGNTNTNWHTTWQQACPLANRWITLDLGAVKTVDGVRTLPRQTGENGIITDYKIEVSTDNSTWRSVANAAWSAGTQWKLASFAPTQARYVKLTAVHTTGTPVSEYASVAEMRVTQTISLVDLKTELTNAIAVAQALKNSVTSSADGAAVAPENKWATPANIATFAGAIDAANTALAAAAASEVRSALGALAAAKTTFEGQCQNGAKALITVTNANPTLGGVALQKPDGTVITVPSTIVKDDLVKLVATPNANQRFVKWVNKTATGGGGASMDSFAFDGTQLEYTANPLILRAKEAVVMQAEFAALETVTAGAPALQMLEVTTNGTNPMRAANKLVSLIGEDGTEGFRSSVSQTTVANYDAYLLTGESELAFTPIFDADAYTVTIDTAAATSGVKKAVAVTDKKIVLIAVTSKTAPITTTTYKITAHIAQADPKIKVELTQNASDAAKVTGTVMVSNANFSAAQLQLKITGTDGFTSFTDAAGAALTAGTQAAGFTLDAGVAGLLTVSAVTYDAASKTFSVAVDTNGGTSIPVVEGTPLTIGTFYLSKPSATALDAAKTSLGTTAAGALGNTLMDRNLRGVRDDGQNAVATSLVYTSAVVPQETRLYSYIGGAPGMTLTRITFNVYPVVSGAVSDTPVNAAPLAIKADGTLEHTVTRGGTYVVKVYAGGYLTHVSGRITAQGAQTYVDGGTLVAGNLNGDTVIDTTDRTVLLTVFNKAATNGAANNIFADFDDDGHINAIDLGRLLLNYTK